MTTKIKTKEAKQVASIKDLNWYFIKKNVGPSVGAFVQGTEPGQQLLEGSLLSTRANVGQLAYLFVNKATRRVTYDTLDEESIFRYDSLSNGDHSEVDRYTSIVLQTHLALPCPVMSTARFRKQIESRRGWKYRLVINADLSTQRSNRNQVADGLELNMHELAASGEPQLLGWPMLSFTALTKLMHPKSKAVINDDGRVLLEMAAAALTRDDVRVISYTSDARVKMPRTSSGGLIGMTAFVTHAKRPAGSTYLRTNDAVYAHTSGYCLVYNRIKRETYLLGQDDGAYFGCLLDGNPKTVAAAIEGLKPRVLRGDKKRKFKRQGEWFALDMSSEQFKRETRNPQYVTRYDAVSLPIDRIDSAVHKLEGYDEVYVAETGRMFVSNKYKNATLTHSKGDHPSLEIRFPYFELARNTAKASVSQDGVD